MPKIFRGVIEAIADARRDLLFRLGRFPGSALLPTRDQALVDAELLLGSSLRKDSSGWWRLPPTLPSGLTDEHPELVALYAAITVEYDDGWAERILRLAELVGRTQPGPIHGSALRWLIEDLCVTAVAEYGDADRGRWAADSAECRRHAEMALALYRGTEWEPLLAFHAEAALGVLDYYADEPLSAKIHLVRCMELHRKVLRIGNFHTRQYFGLACFALGQLLLEQKDVHGALRYLRVASRDLHDSWKSQALVFLAAAELRAGRPRDARDAAREGLRRMPSSETREALEDDLKCSLADALYDLGKVTQAEALLRDVVTHGVCKPKMDWARGFLEKIERKPGR